MADLEPILQQYLPLIDGAEQRAFGLAGAYVQGLATHSSPPDATTGAPPDRLMMRPSDQLITWSDLMAELGPDLPTNWRFMLRVDVYQSPHGPGYVVTAMATEGGKLWTRSVNRGPETAREKTWQVVG